MEKAVMQDIPTIIQLLTLELKDQKKKNQTKSYFYYTILGYFGPSHIVTGRSMVQYPVKMLKRVPKEERNDLSHV